MIEELAYELIEFNKQDSLEVNPRLTLVPAKVRSGFRLSIIGFGNMFSSLGKMMESLGVAFGLDKQPIDPQEEDKFWSNLAESVAGSEYIPELREQFAGRYEQGDILEAVADLFKKGGRNSTERQFVLEEPPAKLPLDSTIHCWDGNGNSYAQSNMLISYSERSFMGPPVYVGNVYHIKKKCSLDDLVSFLKVDNFTKKPESKGS